MKNIKLPNKPSEMWAMVNGIFFMVSAFFFFGGLFHMNAPLYGKMFLAVAMMLVASSSVYTYKSFRDLQEHRNLAQKLEFLEMEKILKESLEEEELEGIQKY